MCKNRIKVFILINNRIKSVTFLYRYNNKIIQVLKKEWKCNNKISIKKNRNNSYSNNSFE